ncbi:hypothetical protein BC829DRAFT_9343 [Chytridium lagenaria]|nr:hypothetical protein BC829DRAFT_9343 [Chytridium lagenaria]
MPKPPQMNLITSGGYSAVTLYDVLTTMNISGIAGDFYSKTTVFSAGVSSQLKVPFCGASQASTSLADKRRFPYFYRTFRAKGVANHITRLFLQWKVQRMAILHSTDDLSVTQAVDAVAAMTQAEIEVSMVGRMTPDMHKRKDYGRIFEVLKSHGCKYIYISALDVQVRDVYHAAIDAGWWDRM